ncbi:MAG: hypothetical protein K8U57_14760 [Planctomycetes bacterium]|nr:hypothetical protein [Planctomycetota bacterium]
MKEMQISLVRRGEAIVIGALPNSVNEKILAAVETHQGELRLLVSPAQIESQNSHAMPILADILQDAGCDNDDILTHCRDPQQVRVRGCRVVEHVLGKS